MKRAVIWPTAFSPFCHKDVLGRILERSCTNDRQVALVARVLWSQGFLLFLLREFKLSVERVSASPQCRHQRLAPKLALVTRLRRNQPCISIPDGPFLTRNTRNPKVRSVIRALLHLTTRTKTGSHGSSKFSIFLSFTLFAICHSKKQPCGSHFCTSMPKQIPSAAKFNSWILMKSSLERHMLLARVASRTEKTRYI